ncbi:OB-fold domain-containing protein [Mycobacterium syngnathidarum]
MDTAEYQQTGTLWTFTTQEFPPKSPPYAFTPSEDFAPYAVGYVEFAGQGLVEGRIECTDLSVLRIGMPMQTRLFAFDRNHGSGTPADPEKTWWTYCFTPIAEETKQ